MKVLSGHNLLKAFQAGARCLERYRDVINALNVFPVPDGDTGTNLLLTMRSGMEQCAEAADATASEVASQIADGTFWGARGNSGVILSQFFQGFADALQGREMCASPDLARAFRQASAAAYQAVGTPVEGTMLSVIRAIAEEAPVDTSYNVVSAWEAAFTSARDALARTPEQLPVLKQAGVVDAGGLGVVAIIGGAWCYLSGQDVEIADLGIGALAGGLVSSRTGGPAVSREFLDATRNVQWGYCTQFLIEGAGIAPEQVRQDFTKVADSVVVTGNDQHVRVHLHALDPGPALSQGVSLGQLSQVKIENMGLQNHDWATQHDFGPGVRQGIAVVAVVPGDGLARLFRASGCAAVIGGGQTMNPSVRQIMEAVAQCSAQDVIILPNNKNIVAAAEQAAAVEALGSNLQVVPTRTIPQGVAALLAFNPEESLEHNLKRMQAASSEIATVEVTRAVRDVAVEGLSVQAGQYIGLVEGKLAVAGATAEAALCSALDRVALTSDKVVTLYWGAETAESQARALAQELEERMPGIQVDVAYGGQPHYPYLASVE